jgi:hypothetical protein
LQNCVGPAAEPDIGCKVNRIDGVEFYPVLRKVFFAAAGYAGKLLELQGQFSRNVPPGLIS